MIRVEVVYARPEEQALVALEMPEGTTVREAIERSGILERFPEIDLTRLTVGIFGRVTGPGTVLADGDRVEIYRPLLADPKEVRRSKAKPTRSRARR
jgi:uncharacterized protein